MGWRALISLVGGKVSAEDWAAAAMEEPPTPDMMKACKECPLRVGGELEEGAAAAIETATPGQRKKMKRWGCHQAPRPCAGMRRLLIR